MIGNTRPGLLLSGTGGLFHNGFFYFVEVCFQKVADFFDAHTF